VKLKLDENLGTSAAELLRRAGHNVSTVHEQNMCSASDRELVTVCVAEKRSLVTLDMDFSNPIVFNPKDYAGIAVLRLPSNPTMNDLSAALRTLLVGLRRADIAGKLWVIRKGKIREYMSDEP
jgi:predicted nuclease of predicted toxin-antitoxin system